MTSENNTFIPVPGGDTTVRVNGTTIKTYGNESKHGIMDASWVDQNHAYGAFPRPEMDMGATAVPNTRKSK